jgi:hypothetical protein
MFPDDITNPAAFDAWVDEMDARACKCGGTCEECEREAAARRRNTALTIDRDREDRARRGLPASRLDASLAATVHDAIDRKLTTPRECGSCGGRGYVPDEPERNYPDGSPRGRECRDCNGDGYLPSLGAMLRIADQREDERALGKLERDLEAMP